MFPILNPPLPIWVNTAWLPHSRKVYLVLWKVLVFHSDCGRCFTFPPGKNENSCSSTSLPAFGISVFWIMAFLIVVQWYLIVLICISLMRYDVEHLSICWFAIYTSALGRHLLWEGVCSGEVSAQFASFLLRFFVFLLLSVKNFCAFWITVLFQTHLLSIFSAGLWLIFSFL